MSTIFCDQKQETHQNNSRYGEKRCRSPECQRHAMVNRKPLWPTQVHDGTFFYCSLAYPSPLEGRHAWGKVFHDMVHVLHCMTVPPRCIVKHVMFFRVPTYGFCPRDGGFHPNRNLTESRIQLSRAIAYPRIGLHDSAIFGA